MAEEPEATSSVFISYSRRNKAFAAKLNDSLDNNGVDAWVDWEGIPLSSDWMEEITRAIEGADAFLFIITPDSLASDVCARELELGLQYNKKLIPVLHIEPEKGQEMHEQLAATNWVYMREQDDYDATIPALLDTIQTDLGWVRGHTRLLQRAKEWEENNQSNSFLLQGDDLNGAEQWMVEAAAQDGREVVPLQAEYIQVSRQAATKRQRNFLIGVSLALVVSVGMAILALFSRQVAVQNEHAAATARVEAEDNANIAATQQVIAEDNAVEAKNQQTIAEHNAIEAQAQRHAAEARIYQADPSALDLSTLLAINSWQAHASDLAEDIMRGNTSISPIPVAQMSQGDAINSIEESPDGKYFLTASEDGSVCLWHPEDGAEKFCVQQKEGVYDAIFSGDSNYLISGSYGGVLKVWSVEDGTEVREYDLDGAAVFDLDLHPNGTLVAVTRDDGYISLVDLSDLDAEPRHLQFDTETLYKGVFSPNGEWLGVGGVSGKTFLWNVARDYFYTGATHTGEIYALDFSADSRWMATGGSDSVIRISEVTANGIARSVMRHGDWIEDLAFGPDGSWVAVSSDDNSLRMWDAATGVEKLRMEHKSFVLRADISDNGAWVASTGSGGTARVWDTVSGSEMLRIPVDGRGSAIKFNETATRLFVGDTYGNLTLWNTSSLLARLNIIEFPELVHEARYSPDGSTVVVNTDQKNVWALPYEDILSLYDGTQGEEIITTDALTYDLTYSPDSVWVAAAASRGKKVFLYKKSSEGDTTDALSQIDLDAKVYAIDFSPDSTQIATADGDGFVRLWDLESGEEVATFENNGSLQGLSFHPDGKTLATSQENQIMIWDVAGETLLKTLSQVGSLHTISYSLDGKWLATASSEGNIYLWDVENNYALSTARLQINGNPYSLDFSPDGKYLAAGSDTYFVFIWDLQLGQEIARLPHSDLVSGVAFSPDGSELLTVARKTVQVWDFPALPVITKDDLVDMACSRLLENMSKDEWNVTHSDGEEYQPLCSSLSIPE